MIIPIADLTHKSLELGNKTALVLGEKHWSYRRLNEDVSCVAANLYAAGYRSGNRILICLENGYEILISTLACMKIGLIVVQAYTDYSEAELYYIGENSGASGIITSKTLYPKLRNIPGIRSVYLVGIETASEKGLPFSSLLEKPACTLPRLVIDPGQPILISYTSGTTAKRKGVVHTYHSVASSIESVVQSFGREVFERPLLFSSLANNGAFMILLLPTFWLGGTVILTPDDRPETVLSAIDKGRPTFFFTFPYYFKHLIHHPIAPKTDFRSLKIVLVGGDVVPKELSQQFFSLTGLSLSQGFGMTESHCIIMNLHPDAAKIGSMGLPAHGVEAKIIDEKGEEMPSGLIGQLAIKREAMTPGYWNFPEETAKALHKGWLHTGDLAVKDQDGYFWFKGRMKNTIVREAENISPIEVEEAICKHPSVRAAGVIGVPDPDWGQAIKAFVELQPEMSLSSVELRSFLQNLLSPYKIPTDIIFVAALPRTLTGKIDRKTLPHL